MRNYRQHFKDKVVFCNCDDPFESNFFKYFAMNFNYLGLKKLICTCYDGSPVSYTELKDSIVLSPTERKPYKIEITEVSDVNGDGSVDLVDVELLLKSDNNNLTILDGNGDFRSEESIEYLKEADIVVTNPPFSLFREYVAQLMKYDKKFLIIGNLNAITYKEIFPLIKHDEMWLGCSLHATKCSFLVPESYEGKSTFYQDGHKMAKVNNAVWFTNLDIAKRHEEIILYKKYNPEDYPKYDNYNAIEVSRVADIPSDYYEIIGVPITYLDKYNPDQFEIVGGSMYDDTPCRIIKNYTELGYKFLKADGHTLSGSGALRDKMSPKIPRKGTSDYSISPDGEFLSSVYQRIFIKRRKHEN